MKRDLTNQLGDWNPQLLREIKRCLKIHNILLPTVISLLGQFILFMYFQTQLPTEENLLYSHSHKYCTGQYVGSLPICLADGLGNVIINWQWWSLDIFNCLSTIGCFSILVGGIYLLINDLAIEERRDTLNFIRLSPQSPQSILWGKILGVPILLYLAVFLVIPLHLWSGLAAKILLSQILTFYVVTIAATIFYYSGALLFGLVGYWLGSFQAWLGSGAVLGFLIFSEKIIVSETSISNEYPFVVLRLISPLYLIPNPAASPKFANFHWFNLPLGASFITTVVFTLLIYFVGSYFVWQSLQRCFRDPNATMLSKKQSYLLTISFIIITIGCANFTKLFSNQNDNFSTTMENLSCLLFLDLWLFLYLIAALSPNRETLQDWARYRNVSQSKGVGNNKLINDLVWGEKSPGVLAIGINAIIAITCLSLFILVSYSNTSKIIDAFIALAFAGSLTMIYAVLAQLLLFMKNEHRLFWTTGVVSAVIILPPVVLTMLFSSPGNNSFFWLFSIAAPLIALYPSGDYTSTMAPFLAILGHCGILGLLVFQLTRKLSKAGESATKVLLAGN
jgi:hypothetical protein